MFCFYLWFCVVLFGLWCFCLGVCGFVHVVLWCKLYFVWSFCLVFVFLVFAWCLWCRVGVLFVVCV